MAYKDRKINGELSTDDFFALACLANRPLSTRMESTEKEDIAEARAKLEAEMFELRKREVQAFEHIAGYLEDIATQLRRGIA